MGPGWVRDGDGRLAPFDIERLSRRLYRVARLLGPADPVLIRELAEAVGLFISQEAIPGKAMPAENFIDAVARGARQLGQPAIAASWLQDHGVEEQRDLGSDSSEGELGADLADLEEQGALGLVGSTKPLLADARLDLSAMSGAEVVSKLVERTRWSRGPFHLVGLERLLVSGAAAGGELAALMGPLVSAAETLERELCLHLPSPGHLARAEREAVPLFAQGAGPLDTVSALDPLVAWLAGTDCRLSVVAHVLQQETVDVMRWRRALARLPREGRHVRVAVGGREVGPVWPTGEQPAILGRARVNLEGETGPKRRDMLARLGVAAGARWRDSIRHSRREQGGEGTWPGIWGLERCPWMLELRGAPADEWLSLESAIRHEAGRAGISVVVVPKPEPLPDVSVETVLEGGPWPRGGCVLSAPGGAPKKLFPDD